eukprot:SAG11_NODE_9551_length_901_cov_1.013716_1_plen_71_part_00
MDGITVVGCGAVGGHVAAHLANAGHTVNVIARGANLAALRSDGLRVVSSVEGGSFVKRVNAVAQARELPP